MLLGSITGFNYRNSSENMKRPKNEKKRRRNKIISFILK